MRLLHRNLTADGILAASRSKQAEDRGYTRIFGRDAAICVMGMVESGDPALVDGAMQSLITLARHQADNGQIPKFVDPVRADSDFWYLGCIDATLWWLIAVHFFAERFPERQLRQTMQTTITKASDWLHCQEHPRLFLVQQNEASDWADIMPRSGFVLYSNALWYFVKRLYGLAHGEQTHYHFNHLFFPFSREIPDYKRLRLLRHYVRNKASNKTLYLSFINFAQWGEEGDVLGNLLAIVFGLAADGPTHRILRALNRAGVNAPYPTRAVVAPIAEDNPLWRPYMGRHQQNLPYQYHNGGVWPFIGSFLVIALAGIGKHSEAREALLKIAHANAVNDWQFNEWFNGRTGRPGGMPGQSWNAAMFLLAQRALEKKIF